MLNDVIVFTRQITPQPRGYDDRGMIYVRYGPPDDWVKIPSHQFIRSNESWVYWIGSGLTFDFLERGGMYYLVSYLTEENINMVKVTDNIANRSQSSMKYLTLIIQE